MNGFFAGIDYGPEYRENQRRSPEERLEIYVNTLRTGMAITAGPEEIMARLYAAGAHSISPDYALQILKYCPYEEGWFVQDGQEPNWGSGVRVAYNRNGQFIEFALRRDIPAGPLYITVELLQPHLGQVATLFTLTYADYAKYEEPADGQAYLIDTLTTIFKQITVDQAA